MAKNLDYKIFQTWNFYSLMPQMNSGYEIHFGHNFDRSKISHFVKSWRWLILDTTTLLTLSEQKK